MATFPNTERDASSPEPAGAGSGIVVHGPRSVVRGAPCVVRGTFRLALSAEGDAPAKEPHRTIVQVLTSGKAHHASTPFENTVLFEDDVTATSQSITGWFNLDAFALAPFEDPGTYFLTVAMGRHLSNTLVLELQG